MKILFSPSEAKRLTPNPQNSPKISIFCDRDEIIHSYFSAIKSGNLGELEQIFGVKSGINELREQILQPCYHKAVLMYDGVAYDALDYANLSSSATKYIDENLLIFSNLYGVLRAGDYVQFYKLKQGKVVGQIDSAKYYKSRLQNALDEILGSGDILDLRAGYYDKFYTIKRPFITMKFLKNGKVVSHYAKYYRGLILRHLALCEVGDFGQMMEIKFPNLSLLNITKSKLKSELVFEINDSC